MIRNSLGLGTEEESNPVTYLEKILKTAHKRSDELKVEISSLEAEERAIEQEIQEIAKAHEPIVEKLRGLELLKTKPLFQIAWQKYNKELAEKKALEESLESMKQSTILLDTASSKVTGETPSSKETNNPVRTSLRVKAAGTVSLSLETRPSGLGTTAK